MNSAFNPDLKYFARIGVIVMGLDLDSAKNDKIIQNADALLINSFIEAKSSAVIKKFSVYDTGPAS